MPLFRQVDPGLDFFTFSAICHFLPSMTSFFSILEELLEISSVTWKREEKSVQGAKKMETKANEKTTLYASTNSDFPEWVQWDYIGNVWLFCPLCERLFFFSSPRAINLIWLAIFCLKPKGARSLKRRVGFGEENFFPQRSPPLFDIKSLNRAISSRSWRHEHRFWQIRS